MIPTFESLWNHQQYTDDPDDKEFVKHFYEQGKRDAIPDGWKIEPHGDWEIRVINPSGDRWRFRDVDDNGGSDSFIYSLLKSMIAAAQKGEEE